MNLLFADFLSSNSLVHISKLVQNGNFLVKNGLFICEWKIQGPNWQIVSTANYEGNLYMFAKSLKKLQDPKKSFLIKCFCLGLHSTVSWWGRTRAAVERGRLPGLAGRAADDAPQHERGRRRRGVQDHRTQWPWGRLFHHPSWRRRAQCSICA